MTNVAFEALEKELRKCRVSFEHKDTELVETKDQLARAQVSSFNMLGPGYLARFWLGLYSSCLYIPRLNIIAI